MGKKTSKLKVRAMKRYLFIFILLAAAPALVFGQTPGQGNAVRDSSVESMVRYGDFVFQAQTALPMRGRVRYLTSPYDLSVSRDTLEAYLPYFGRAYSAPIDPTKGGIEFTSTRFQYKIVSHKKGRWNILIKPEDVNDVQQLSLSVSGSGYASLQVLSTRRQPISFNGRITARK